MAPICGKIGCQRFNYLDNVRLQRHKVLQLKSKIKLTNLLLRKHCKNNFSVIDDFYIADRQGKYMEHLRQQLEFANILELQLGNLTEPQRTASELSNVMQDQLERQENAATVPVRELPNGSRLLRSGGNSFPNNNSSVAPQQVRNKPRLVSETNLHKLQLKIQLEDWNSSGSSGDASIKRHGNFHESSQVAAKRARLE